MKLELAAGQERTEEASGQFLFIESATGPVLVTVTLESGIRTSVKLKEGDQAEVAVPFTSLNIRNISGAANTVIFETGFVRYIPKLEGGAVTITGQTVPLEVITNPASPIEAVINGGVTAQITDPVAVFTEVGSFVQVFSTSASPVITTHAINQMVTGEEVLNPGPYSFPAQSGRVRLIIKADPGNTGNLYIDGAAGSGYLLAPGEKEDVPSLSGFDVHAATPGDKFSYMICRRV